MSIDRPRETNVIVKDPRKVDVLFGYCYPSTYRAGMTGLALQIFYSTLNSRDDTSCERYFRHQTPNPARSLESGRRLRRNHILGFTLTYEEDILNLIQMLEEGGIPTLASARTSEDPVVIVGGPVGSANPQPYVDFVDAFVIGDGDLVIHELINTVKNASSRKDVIDDMAELKGVYVPTAEPESVRRLTIGDLDSLDYPLAQVVPEEETDSRMEPVFGRSFLLEVTRGCGHSCKFCLVGHVCRPRRTRSLNRLVEIIERGIPATGVDKVSLIGSSLGDLDQLEELVCGTIDRNLQVSVPSLRADSVTEALLECLVKGGQRTFTIAPETGSQSLRRNMGKGLDDAAIHDAVKMAASAGYRSLKLYFVIGLPGESEADLDATTKMIQDLAASSGMRVTASINPFIPKAQTRWQREPQLAIKEMRRRLKKIENGLKGSRVTIESLDLRSARIQAALSIGDSSLGRVILKAATYGGYGGWRRGEKETGIPFMDLASNPIHLEGGLPWAFLNT
ncbi:radical SAM protein [Candidatus Thorarchaeota archaeon]|nr:MAG: radical SAM protein [Candidatus Thorarchaeota archaeon]